MSALGRFAGRVGHYGVIFAAGSAASVLLGIATAAVVARHLAPAEFGRLTGYLLLPSLLMTVATLGSLQGTMNTIFGHGGEDDGGIDAADGPRSEPRAVLGTGLIITVVVSLVLGGIVALLAGSIAGWLGAVDDGSALVRIGAVSAALGAAWRLLSNFLRYARRPIAYVVSEVTRPAAALVLAIVFLHQGRGISGVIWAYAGATAIALLVTVGFARRDVRLRFDRANAASIARNGRGLVPVGLSFWVIQNADFYLLLGLAGPVQAGIYRLATTLSRAASYGVSAFTMAWGPVLHTPVHEAAERERGREVLGAATVHAYVATASAGALLLGMAAEWMVRIAPSTFGSAASLVPLLALVPLARGLLVTTYVSSPRPDRRTWFIALAALALPAFLGGCLLTIPRFGAYGAGATAVGAFLAPALIQLVRSSRGEHRLPLSAPRIIIPPCAAGVLIVAFLATAPDATAPRAALAAGATLAYALALLATGVLRGRDVFSLWGAACAGMSALGSRRRLYRALRELDDDDAALLDDLVRRRVAIEDAANARGISPLAVHVRFGVLLRRLGRLDGAGVGHPELSALLLSRDPAAIRADSAQRLVAEGASPAVIDGMERLVARLRHMRWRERSPTGAAAERR